VTAAAVHATKYGLSYSSGTHAFSEDDATPHTHKHTHTAVTRSFYVSPPSAVAGDVGLEGTAAVAAE